MEDAQQAIGAGPSPRNVCIQLHDRPPEALNGLLTLPFAWYAVSRRWKSAVLAVVVARFLEQTRQSGQFEEPGAD
jgi:hypothetical protein